ncbi:MAG: 2Fe-2S iron-sulfur cluster-binding protein [Flavisolibacter sp.]
MATIKIASDSGVVQVIRNVKSGNTLLEILLQNKVAVPHECGGMCTCSTCHVYIFSGMQNLEPKNVREEHFLRKANAPLPSSRLSCQCVVLDANAVIEIRIPGQSIIPARNEGQ